MSSTLGANQVRSGRTVQVFKSRSKSRVGLDIKFIVLHNSFNLVPGVVETAEMAKMPGPMLKSWMYNLFTQSSVYHNQGFQWCKILGWGWDSKIESYALRQLEVVITSQTRLKNYFSMHDRSFQNSTSFNSVFNSNVQ